MLQKLSKMKLGLHDMVIFQISGCVLPFRRCFLVCEIGKAMAIVFQFRFVFLFGKGKFWPKFQILCFGLQLGIERPIYTV